MENNELHPSVQKFKQFVKKYPEMANTVRNNENTWQELYEDWYLLGEEDPKWNVFQDVGEAKKESTKSESTKSGSEEKGWVNHITGILKNMDTNQVQHHISNLSEAIGAIQGVLLQFQGDNAKNTEEKPAERQHPFAFRKD